MQMLQNKIEETKSFRLHANYLIPIVEQNEQKKLFQCKTFYFITNFSSFGSFNIIQTIFQNKMKERIEHLSQLSLFLSFAAFPFLILNLFLVGYLTSRVDNNRLL